MNTHAWLIRLLDPCLAVLWAVFPGLSLSSVDGHAEVEYAYLDPGQGIVVVTEDGRQLVPNSGQATSFCWDRDGKSLIIASAEQVKRLRLDGHSQLLCSGDWEARFPDVCEKTGRIVFSAKQDFPEARWRLKSLHADGGDATDHGEGYDPCISPDGSRLFFEDFGESASLFQLELVSGHRSPFLDASKRRTTINIDANGSRVCFSEEGELVEYDLFTGQRKQWTQGGAYCRFATYSPNGESVLFYREDGERKNLIQADRASGEERVVLAGSMQLADYAPVLPMPVRLTELEDRSARNIESLSLELLHGVVRESKPYPWRLLSQAATSEEEKPANARGLFLHGCKALSPEQAAAIANRPLSRRLFLPDLLELSVPAARALFRDDAPWSLQLGIRDCSPVLARHIGSLRASEIRLDGLKTISVACATELARIHGPFSLDGLRELGPEVARALAAWNGNGEKFYLSLDGIEHLSRAAAAEFRQCGGWGLSFGAVTQLTPEVIEALAGYRGASLRLNGVREFPLVLAEQVASLWSIKFLEMNGLGEVDPGVAETLEQAGIYLWQWN